MFTPQKRRGETAKELLVRAAYDREILIGGERTGNAPRDAHDGTAAHAAAHHHKVAVVDGNAERTLGVLLAHAGAEHPAHRNAAGAQPLGCDAAAEKVAGKRCGGNEVAVERAVLHAGRAGVVGCDQAGFEMRQPGLYNLADHEGGKGVCADDRIIPAAGDEAAERFRTLREITVERGAFVKLLGVLLCRAVAHAEQPRCVAVECARASWR